MHKNAANGQSDFDDFGSASVRNYHLTADLNEIVLNEKIRNEVNQALDQKIELFFRMMKWFFAISGCVISPLLGLVAAQQSKSNTATTELSRVVGELKIQVAVLQTKMESSNHRSDSLEIK